MKRLAILASLALIACHSQPSVTEANTTTEAQLTNISAHTNETDGMDQGNALFASPTSGPGSQQATKK